MIIPTFLDANFLHVIVTGKSVTAVFDWYLKRQANLETTKYGSEFVAATTAAE